MTWQQRAVSNHKQSRCIGRTARTLHLDVYDETYEGKQGDLNGNHHPSLTARTLLHLSRTYWTSPLHRRQNVSYYLTKRLGTNSTFQQDSSLRTSLPPDKIVGYAILWTTSDDVPISQMEPSHGWVPGASPFTNFNLHEITNTMLRWTVRSKVQSRKEKFCSEWAQRTIQATIPCRPPELVSMAFEFLSSIRCSPFYLVRRHSTFFSPSTDGWKKVKFNFYSTNFYRSTN